MRRSNESRTREISRNQDRTEGFATLSFKAPLFSDGTPRARRGSDRDPGPVTCSDMHDVDYYG